MYIYIYSKLKHMCVWWWWWWLIFTDTNFILSDLKKDNTWFTLKSCFCVQKVYQEALQAHYSFDKLGGYEGLYCTKYYETQI